MKDLYSLKLEKKKNKHLNSFGMILKQLIKEKQKKKTWQELGKKK